MLATAFPDLHWLKKQANTAFGERRSPSGEPLSTSGWPNVIMNAKASHVVRDDIRGPLSIFANRTGSTTVSTGQKRVLLNPGVFFITNDDQYYTLEIGNQPAETANIHFGQTFMREAFRSMSDDPASLLEQPAGEIPTFHNRVVPIDAAFRQIMDSLLEPGHDALAEEERLFHLLTLLVADEARLRKRQQAITALRASTREEIMKRLLQATDYLHTVTDSQPDLDQLARISCLSKFHFLRLFTIAFGQTPHQFISALKLNRARRLLETTNTEVRQIAASLGYRDSSTFSRLFHRHLGVYPSQYRAQA